MFRSRAIADCADAIAPKPTVIEDDVQPICALAFFKDCAMTQKEPLQGTHHRSPRQERVIEDDVQAHCK